MCDFSKRRKHAHPTLPLRHCRQQTIKNIDLTTPLPTSLKFYYVLYFCPLRHRETPFTPYHHLSGTFWFLLSKVHCIKLPFVIPCFIGVNSALRMSSQKRLGCEKFATLRKYHKNHKIFELNDNEKKKNKLSVWRAGNKEERHSLPTEGKKVTASSCRRGRRQCNISVTSLLFIDEV